MRTGGTQTAATHKDKKEMPTETQTIAQELMTLFVDQDGKDRPKYAIAVRMFAKRHDTWGHLEEYLVDLGHTRQAKLDWVIMFMPCTKEYMWTDINRYRFSDGSSIIALGDTWCLGDEYDAEVVAARADIAQRRGVAA